jgi:hypothetical protein
MSVTIVIRLRDGRPGNCGSIHSWDRDNVLFLFSSTQFVVQINHMFFLVPTCFGLMGPSSGTLDLTIAYFSFCYSPYTGQCLHIGSALYSFYVMPCVAKRIEY